jgi:signal transduction histidine kinase
MSVDHDDNGSRTGGHDGRSQPVAAVGGAVAGLLETVSEVTVALGFTPAVRLLGPVGELPPDVLTDLRAVLREALTDVVEPARARAARVDLAVTHGRVTLRVTGEGIRGAGARTDAGLADMRRRAKWHGGDLAVGRATAGGTQLTWAVPLR